MFMFVTVDPGGPKGKKKMYTYIYIAHSCHYMSCLTQDICCITITISCYIATHVISQRTTHYIVQVTYSRTKFFMGPSNERPR